MTTTARVTLLTPSRPGPPEFFKRRTELAGQVWPGNRLRGLRGLDHPVDRAHRAISEDGSTQLIGARRFPPASLAVTDCDCVDTVLELLGGTCRSRTPSPTAPRLRRAGPGGSRRGRGACRVGAALDRQSAVGAVAHLEAGTDINHRWHPSVRRSPGAAGGIGRQGLGPPSGLRAVPVWPSLER